MTVLRTLALLHTAVFNTDPFLDPHERPGLLRLAHLKSGGKLTDGERDSDRESDRETGDEYAEGEDKPEKGEATATTHTEQGQTQGEHIQTGEAAGESLAETGTGERAESKAHSMTDGESVQSETEEQKQGGRQTSETFMTEPRINSQTGRTELSGPVKKPRFGPGNWPWESKERPMAFFEITQKLYNEL